MPDKGRAREESIVAIIIQIRFQYSDRELVEQITENPYPQYFISLPSYQEPLPFDAGTPVLFRKRVNVRMFMEANEYLLQENKPEKEKDDNDHHNPPSGNGFGTPEQSADPESKGSLTMDATCAPVYIRYPRDVSLLNEAREKGRNDRMVPQSVRRRTSGKGP